MDHLIYLAIVAARGRGKAPPRSTAAGWTASSESSSVVRGPTAASASTLQSQQQLQQKQQQQQPPPAIMLRRPDQQTTAATTMAPASTPDNIRQFYIPSGTATASSVSSLSPSSNGNISSSGSLERAKRPDQQYYQTKRNIFANDPAVVGGSATAASINYQHEAKHESNTDKHQATAAGGSGSSKGQSVSTFHRVGSFGPKPKQQQQQPPPQPPTPQHQQHQQQQSHPHLLRPGVPGGVRMISDLPRQSENPFTRNLARDRRDSTCSENVGHSGGGGGGNSGGRSIVTSSNRSIWLPNNIDAMPPRFRKKFLQENNLDPSILDKPRTNGIIVDTNQAHFVGKLSLGQII